MSLTMANSMMTRTRSQPRGDKRRDRIVKFVETYTLKHGFAPATDEIGKGVGLSSTNAVREHIHVLLLQGRLARVEGKSRTVRVVPPEEQAAAARRYLARVRRAANAATKAS
jgi:SOS-response transcriptional repressor LexA